MKRCRFVVGARDSRLHAPWYLWSFTILRWPAQSGLRYWPIRGISLSDRLTQSATSSRAAVGTFISWLGVCRSFWQLSVSLLPRWCIRVGSQDFVTDYYDSCWQCSSVVRMSGLWPADFPCPVANLSLTGDHFLAKLSTMGNQVGQLSLSSFWGWQISSNLNIYMDYGGGDHLSGRLRLRVAVWPKSVSATTQRCGLDCMLALCVMHSVAEAEHAACNAL